MIDYNRIHELKIDEVIWIIFIILSFFNIIGDECEKDYCVIHDLKNKKTSKMIFNFTLFASLLIYIYLEYQRNNKLKIAKINHESNVFLWQVRNVGGVLVIIATILFLYCQIMEPEPINPSIV